MRIDFYHLQKQTLDQVLPKLLDKAYGSKKNIIVKVGNEEHVEFINSNLWIYDDAAFLPHGTKKDGNSSLQPIWITNEDDNPNQAEILVLVDGAEIELEKLKSFNRVLNIFDGNSEEALTQARRLWKEYKDQDFELYYWQQDSNGSWQQKA